MRWGSCSECFEGVDESGSRLALVNVKIANAPSSAVWKHSHIWGLQSHVPAIMTVTISIHVYFIGTVCQKTGLS